MIASSGLLLEQSSLARQLALVFAEHTTAAAAFRVSLHEGELRWSAGDERADSEPHASFARRVLARLSGWLPLEAQL